MPSTIRSIIAAAALALIAACGAVTPPPGLAAEATALLAREPVGTEVPASRWGQAINALAPERVYVSPEGLYIARSSFFVEERGVFVPRSKAFQGTPGTDPGYTPIRAGVFSYVIKG